VSHLSNSHGAHFDSEMTEELRFAYLQAMEIDCWVPKSELRSVEENFEIKSKPAAESPTAAKTPLESALIVNQPIIEQLIDKQPIGEHDEKIIPQTLRSEPDRNITQTVFDSKDSAQTASFSATKEFTPKNKAASNKYLKLVSWTNQTIKEENSKNILIICRHQIDQPANSFARVNSPSQFMLDYINALIGLLPELSFELKIQLAHLSEAGLGKDSSPMDEVLGDCKPDLVLLLGDETAAHLLDKQADVASLRGRLVELEQNHQALVSYHPFSMIENPALKSLALEDLSNLVSYLLQNNRS
jgi:hypothetical protein